MAEKDTTEKILEAHNDVFSDIMNVALFGGVDIINEKALSDGQAFSQYKFDDEIHVQERDVCKHWTDGNVQLALFGVENQSTVDRDMPLRVIGYDGAAYRGQLFSESTEDGSVMPTRDGWTGEDFLGKMKEPFVNVMPVDGPITRNGGACSYGSRDIRDWMMKAADNKFCQGHVLTINTPGGSAWAKNDFQQGIEYAHARGQRVIAFIDGLCASAGMYLASLCDEVYVMNPKDQLGCVGVMAAFFTMKNGDKDLSTGETYREYYATKSINKNKEMRDIAENDDAKLLIEELDNLEAEFRADMKAAFPNTKDEHLDGKIFDAKDVMGILCDGEMMLSDVISRVFNLANGTEKPIERTANRKIAKRSKAGSGEPMQQALAAGKHTAQQINNILLNKNNSINMKEKFPALFAALQVEEMQMTEEGAFMNEGLLATLNAAFEAKEKAIADAQALVESLNQEKANLTQQVADLNAQIETLKTEHANALTEKDNTIATLEQDKTTLQNDMECQNAQV